MEYAKVEGGQVTQVGLPQTGQLKDGRTVSGFNLLDETTLKGEGWLPLVDNPPEYDAETEYLERTGYSIAWNEVIIQYLIKQREPVVTIPTVEERLAAIEEALQIII